MGRLVAISSGELDTTRPINRHALSLTGKESPSMLFIPTASDDSEDYIQEMHREYQGLVKSFEALCLSRRGYTAAELKEILMQADLIYVGGGDTICMMEQWRKCGLDVLLKEVYEKDSAVLTGISAGAICWFMRGYSDSIPGEHGPVYGMTGEMLGIVPYAICPHFEDPQRKAFVGCLRSDEKGIAMESNTAYVRVGEEEYFLRSKEDAEVYLAGEGALIRSDTVKTLK